MKKIFAIAAISAATLLGAVSFAAAHWSTVLNGMQIDFETFKTEFGGD